MTRFILSLFAGLVAMSAAHGQTPSYSKDIRPFLAKYCVECHNPKALKGSLDLESYKALMEGADAGPVVKAGKPDESKLVLLVEHKSKPTMPPAKAKVQPTKDEIKLLRAWVAAGATDDGANVKVELPVIKVKADVLAPVTGLSYASGTDTLFFARDRQLTLVELSDKNLPTTTVSAPGPISALVGVSLNRERNFVALGIGRAGRGEENAELGVYWPGATAAIAKLEGHSHGDRISDVAYHVPSRSYASGSYDAQIRVHNHQKKHPVHLLKEHSDAVYGLAFNPDGTLLASVSADRAMKIWDVEKGKLLYTLGEATDWLYTVAWSPDGKYLVSGGVDKSIRVYEPTPTGAKLRQSVFAHEGPVQKVLFSSDSKTLYSVGQDRVIKAWDVAKMVERKVYDKQPETVLCMALREDAGQIVIGRYDGIVQLIDMKSGKVVHEFGKDDKKQPKPRAERSDSRGSHAEGLSFTGAAGKRPMPPLTNIDSPGQSPATGQTIKLPVYLAGTLDRAGAVHFFRFDAAKGQSIGVRLQSAELKSKLDPVLVVTDMTGRIVAESSLGHLGHTFDAKGSYALGVRDREYRGGTDFTYRLQIGDIPVVTSVFPRGLQRGTKGEIQLEGVFLPTTSVAFSMPADAKPGASFPLPIVGDGPVLGKAEIVAGEFPEVLTLGKFPVPGTANGRLLKDNQKDTWTFDARKGQSLVIEVNARRLGSRLDSIIEILDKNDQPVPRAVLRSQAKTHVTFRDHDSAQGNIRIEAWSELGVNDYLYVGNELMKIQALPTHPDADCNFFATQGQRIGYLDTTPTHHANNTPMYKVNVHPPGMTFPPNGFPVFTLYYRNDDGGPGFGRDARLIFEPPADGEYKIRIADARGMGGVNFGYRVTVRHPSPGFSLKAAPKTPSVSRGSALPITITAERFDGFDGPILVNFSGVPKGLHLPATIIEAGTYSTTVALHADADAKVSDKARLTLEGYGRAGGSRLVFIGDLDLPKLIEPGDIVTTVKESEVAIKPGGQTKLTVTIERRNGFKGRVPLDVKGLPHGVRVLDIGLNGILVNENETTRTIVIYADPWVQAQDHPFVVLARREGKNTEHAAKSVLLKVR